MKKLYASLSAFLLLGFSTSVQAQCADQRYENFVFDSVTLTADVSYGENIAWTGSGNVPLALDVRVPAGDTETSRPLILFVHGGSFVGGSKDGIDVVPLAEDFAKMGYVTASVQYRLGMNTLPPDSTSATEAVIRGYHDVKAAIRFFRENADVGGNTYGIDPNQVFVYGISAGGLVADHIAYLDQDSELPTYVDYTKPGLEGGVAGQSGNAGYPDDVTAIISVAGALRDTAWMEAGDTPIMSFHSVNDGTVPYGQDVIAPFFNIPILLVNGSSPVHVKAEELGLINCLHTWGNPPAGEEHVPHVTNTEHYDSLLVQSRNFLQSFVCGITLNCEYTTAVISVGINDLVTDQSSITVYPNPVAANFTIDLTELPTGSNYTVKLMDQTGRLVQELPNVSSQTLAINGEDFAAGLYFVNVLGDGVLYSRKFIVE